jgi:hypothetical protein
MKRCIALLLVATAAAFGSIQVYSVEPVDMAHSAFVTSAQEDFVATSDTILYTDIFLGSQDSVGSWQAEILDENNVRQGNVVQVRCSTSLQYSFVHFVFSPGVSVQKGSKYILDVKHSSGQAVTQVFWNPNGEYSFGHVSLTGTSLMPPAPSPNCNLAARIVGVAYNDPLLISSWDNIPAIVFDTTQHPGLTQEQRASVLTQGAAVMNEMGFRGTRITDLWNSIQPDSTNAGDTTWEFRGHNKRLLTTG